MIAQSSQQPAENRPKKISQPLQHAPWFRDLVQHLDAMQHLQTLFTRVCDIELARHCQVYSFNNGILSIKISDSGWATRLRYQTPELIKALGKFQEFKGIKKIQIKINTPNIAAQRQRLPTPISAESAQSLAEVAKTIKDPTLQAALLKLARNE